MKNYEYEEASFYLERMEKKIGNDLLNQQYLKRWKAVVNYYNKKICAKMYLKQLKETISMTVPNYNKYLDEIYPFTEQELLIMMNLAGAYSEVKEYEKSIKIYQMLITCIEEGYIDTKNGGILKIVIKRNMAHTFGPLKRYQEAIDILKEVYELCLKLDYGYEIQLLLGDIAWNMMKQIEIGVRKNEDIALVKKYLRQSYYISAAREAANMCNKTKEYWNKYFDEEIEII
jgi:tetratricopeptide (TPR) repeat protein